MDPVDALRNAGGVASLGELVGQTTHRALRTAVQHKRVVRLAHNCYALASVDWRDIPENSVIHDVTDRVATVIDCARAYDRDVALAVADSALREGEVTRYELQVAAERSPRTGHAAALWIAEHATALAANPFESVARAIALTVPGLDARPQVSIDGVGRVDLCDECLGIVIECESFEFHATSDQLRRDVTRYTACARRGLVVVRFTWAQVMFEPDYVREALIEVVLWRQRQVRPERP